MTKTKLENIKLDIVLCCGSLICKSKVTHHGFGGAGETGHLSHVAWNTSNNFRELESKLLIWGTREHFQTDILT